jgi:cation transport ATPase
MVAVLVIASPCALGLQRLTAIMVSTAGVPNWEFFSAPVSPERAGSVRWIVLDKTEPLPAANRP